MRAIYWLIFFAAIWFIGRSTNRITEFGGKENTIIKLELADKAQGSGIVKAWAKIKYHDEPLTVQARLNTYWDWLFIIIYVALIISESSALIDVTPVYWLNELLRMNIFLALLAGIFDYIEDGIILHNLNLWVKPEDYISSAIPAFTKWILAGWCVVLWLVAIVARLIARGRKTPTARASVSALNSINFVKNETLFVQFMPSFDIETYLKANQNSIANRVKITILFTYGDSEPLTSEIEDDRDLADLGFGDDAFVKLTQRFNIIIDAKKPGADQLDPTDVSKFSTVQDCIYGVTKAAS